MSPVLVEVALGLTRIVTYVGYVLLAGTFTFWSLVWPDGRRDRRLVRLAVIGTVLLALGTFADPAFRVALAGQPLADVLTPAIGAALLVRLAALAATAFFLVDLIRSPITGGRRVFAVLVVAVVASSMVVQSDADRLFPVRMGREVFDAATVPKQMVVLRGYRHEAGHDDPTDDYWAPVVRFLQRGGPSGE